MDVDGNSNNNTNNYDSMSEEEEYEPIDYTKYKKKSRKSNHKRAERNFVVDDEQDIEYVRPKKKKRKKMMDNDDTNTNTNNNNNNNMKTSTSIITAMKKNKDYEKRSTTKIVNKTPNNNHTKKIKKKARTHKTKNNFFGTRPLIEQKATQNSMYSNIALTTQEKYLQTQYKLIQQRLSQHKNQTKNEHKAMDLDISIEEAIGNNLTCQSSSNIILEPGQSQTKHTPKPIGFGETFIKLSTQYIAQQNMSSSFTNDKKTGIDIDYYFGENNERDNMRHRNQQKMEINQKKAIEKLKLLGDTQIGKIKKKNISNEKKKQFSIKRRKQANKKMIHLSVQKKEKVHDELNNNAFDVLLDDNVDNNADEILANVEKAELALQFASDKPSSFIDDETHSENCNVYVGGLHPECDEMTLRKLFKHCGDIKQIRLDWRKKGFGFIHYQTHQQAIEAIQDMDGRLIMGQPIKCRWAKNKMKEKELLLLLKEKEMKEKEGLLVGDVVGGDDGDNINTNHPQVGVGFKNVQQQVRVQGSGHGRVEEQLQSNTVTSIGFLSKRMTGKYSRKHMSGPPALVKVGCDKDKKDEVVDNKDVEYW